MLASLPAAGGCDNIPSRLLSPTQKGMSLSADQLVSQILRLRGTNRVEGSLDSAKGHAGHMPLKLAAFPTPRPWKHCHVMLAVPPPELPAMQVGPQGQIHILNLPRVRTPESLRHGWRHNPTQLLCFSVTNACAVLAATCVPALMLTKSSLCERECTETVCIRCLKWL